MIEGEYKVIIEHNGDSETKDVMPNVLKRAPGRPRKFAKDENTVVLGIRVKEEEALFLEEYGGKYGGKTGYVTHLIQKEMERLGVTSK